MKNSNKLTVIIAFKNEGDEVEKTVKSVAESSRGRVGILLVNDNSDDGYDYEKIAKKYGCRYISSFASLGVARARDMGVRASETEYFVLMDGHMRIYDEDFDKRVLDNLKRHPKSIICSATSNIAAEKSGKEYYGGQFGAYVNFVPGEEYTLKWMTGDLELNEDSEVRQIPCVLGAFYASSCSHWDKIGGLDGLNGYGFDETWMSIKTWLVGGECLNLKDFVTGHLYRNTPSAAINYDKYYANQILMNKFFTQDEQNRGKYAKNLAEKIGEEAYRKAEQTLNYGWLDKQRREFFENRAELPMDKFLEINTRGLHKTQEMC